MRNNTIKIISLELKKLKVNKFFSKEKTADFSVFFNDNLDKEIIVSVDLKNLEGVAEKIVNNIINMEKNLHKEFDGVALLNDSVKVIVKDLDSIIPRVKAFLNKIAEYVDKVRALKTADGYLDLVGKINRMELIF